MSNPPATVDRTLVLPEVGGERSTTLDVPRPLSPMYVALRYRLPWTVPTAIATIVVRVVFAFALTRDGGSELATSGAPTAEGPATPADTLVAPPAAPNAVLAIGTARSFTSTVQLSDGQDLFAALAANPTGAGLGGSPVTGDAVVVREVFGSDAFSVASHDGGAPVLVYVPGATDELQGFVPGSTEVLFEGTLYPTPSDLGDFLGYEPASVARTGTYVVAVPETVMQVDPPTV